MAQDTIAPVAVCYNGLAADLLPVDLDGDGNYETGQVILYAMDFDGNSFDDVTSSENLIVSFSSDVSDIQKIFKCSDLGTNPLQIWVTDEAGNKGTCATYIIIQDPGNSCGGVLPMIVGNVKTELSMGVQDVEIVISSISLPPDTVVSQQSGQYIAGLFLYKEFKLEPKLDKKPLNGVTTQDLVLIQRHILNKQPLTTIGQLAAADVNKSDDITIGDLIELRKVILGKIPNFSNNYSWRIIAKDGPTSLEDIKESLIVWVNDGFIDGVDFLGVKVGDVNNSAKPNSNYISIEDRNSQVLNFLLDDQSVKAGESYSLGFKSSDFNSIEGFQFTLNFDQNALSFSGIESGKLDISEDNFGLTMLDRGQITSSWNQIEGLSTDPNDVVFRMNFIAKSDGTLSDMIRMSSDYTPAEAYNGASELMNLNLKFESLNQAYELYQNVPNPVLNSTMIGFNLPEEMAAKLTIFDVNGKVLKTVQQMFNKGDNQVKLTRLELASAGVLFYTLETADFTATKQMILLE
ncbi:MAG: T9SS type A sorting domain-containing protein [Saprospiraceae bacterium]